MSRLYICIKLNNKYTYLCKLKIQTSMLIFHYLNMHLGAVSFDITYI